MAANLSKTAINIRSALAKIFKPKYAELPVQKWFYNLVTNGLFGTDLSGWTNNGSHWAYSSGTAYHASSSVFNPLSQQLTGLIKGKTYSVSVDYVRTSGDIKFGLDDNSGVTSGTVLGTASASGTLVETFTFDGVDDWIWFSRDTTTSEFTIDNISVREVLEIPSDSANIKVYENGLLLMQDAEYRDGYTLADDGFKKTITLDSTGTPETDEVLVEYYKKL